VGFFVDLKSFQLVFLFPPMLPFLNQQASHTCQSGLTFLTYVLTIYLIRCDKKPLNPCTSGPISVKNAHSQKQKSKISIFFISLPHIELQESSIENRDFFRLKTAHSSNYRGSIFLPSLSLSSMLADLLPCRGRQYEIPNNQ
jgi:hypothetical protein